ncbi:MAG: hypothetical protein E7374_00015 [Clostridiales bacterium]|nr:hypothetical protein [Clostridiales bacterium]
MSTFEIVLLICAILTPFVSLLFVIPKKKRRTKIIQEPKKEKVEEKIEYQKPANLGEHVESSNIEFQKNEVSSDDFKSYLDKKERKISGSKEFNRFEDYYRLDRFNESKRSKSEAKPNGNIADMDEKTKAILIANVLSRKYFD